MRKSYSMILIALCLLACFIISACSNNAAKSANATPTTAPTTVPTAAPTTESTAAPTINPTAAPTAAPATAPTAAPTTESTAAPTINPTAAPTIAPTTASTVASTAEIGQGEQNNGTTAPIPPGVMITFKSLTNLEKFVSAVNSQDTQFTEYAQIYAGAEQKKYKAARKLADNYTAATVFGNKSDIRCDSSGGTYNVDSNTLDLTCKIKGINYRFIYSFGADAPPQYEGEPVLRDVKVGHFAFDLYQGTGNRLVGAIMDGETEIRIVVMYAEQVSDIDFSAFTLFKLGAGSLSK